MHQHSWYGEIMISQSSQAVVTQNALKLELTSSGPHSGQGLFINETISTVSIFRKYASPRSPQQEYGRQSAATTCNNLTRVLAPRLLSLNICRRRCVGGCLNSQSQQIQTECTVTAAMRFVANICTPLSSADKLTVFPLAQIRSLSLSF